MGFQHRKDYPVLVNHSTAYCEIINLLNLAEHHRQFCDGSCAASLYLVQRTARRLLAYTWPNERQDIILKIQHSELQ